jgi:hypothetical protein
MGRRTPKLSAPTPTFLSAGNGRLSKAESAQARATDRVFSRHLLARACKAPRLCRSPLMCALKSLELQFAKKPRSKENKFPWNMREKKEIRASALATRPPPPPPPPLATYPQVKSPYALNPKKRGGGKAKVQVRRKHTDTPFRPAPISHFTATHVYELLMRSNTTAARLRNYMWIKTSGQRLAHSAKTCQGSQRCPASSVASAGHAAPHPAAPRRCVLC